jgi:hypothetical protein
MDLLAQLARGTRTNDAVLGWSKSGRVLDVSWLRRRRCVGKRALRRGREHWLRLHFCSLSDYCRLGCRQDRRWCLDLGDGCRGFGRGHLRRRLLRGALGWRRLFRLDRPNQAVTLCLSANSVRLCFLDRRGVALHADAELDTEIERLFVGEA